MTTSVVSSIEGYTIFKEINRTCWSEYLLLSEPKDLYRGDSYIIILSTSKMHICYITNLTGSWQHQSIQNGRESKHLFLVDAAMTENISSNTLRVEDVIWINQVNIHCHETCKHYMITNIHEQICLHMSPGNEHWTGLHMTYIYAWNVAFMMFIPFVKLHTYKNTAIIGIVYCSLLVFTILQKCMHASFLLSYSAGRFCMKYWLTCNH